MKRTVIVIGLAISCLAAVAYGLTRAASARHTAQYASFASSKPLVLDAATQGILSGADRVETFRLAGGDFDETPKITASLEGHVVLHVGQTQGRAFATEIKAALAQAEAGPDGAQCFDPGVGFRVWKGSAHTDICVCFTCAGIEIITKNTHHKTVHQSLTTLGGARPAFLALSQQAFPQDTALAAL